MASPSRSASPPRTRRPYRRAPPVRAVGASALLLGGISVRPGGNPTPRPRGRDERENQSDTRAADRRWARAGEPDRSGRPLAARGAQARRARVPGGQPHRLGGGPDVLLDPRDLPGDPRAHIGARPARGLRDPDAARQHAADRAGAGAGDLQRRDHEPAEPPGRGRRAVLRGARPRAVVGVGLRRGLHARLQRHLGRRGGAPDLEDAADPAAHDARPAHHAGRRHRRGDVHGAARRAGRQAARRARAAPSRSGTSRSGR